MLNPVKPVTHCWCQGALLPLCWGSGSCGGASWIFREGRIPGFLVGQEQQGHTGDTVPPQVPLGAAWTFLSQCMENHLEPPVRETEPLPETPQGRSGELPRNSFPWLCPGPAAPLGAVDGRTRPRSGVSPAPGPWFWGHSGISVVLRSDSHPHTGCLTFLGGWNGVIGLAGGILLEPGMSLMQLWERWSGRCHHLRVLCKFQHLSSLFGLNEGASLILSRILFLGLLSFLSLGALGLDFFGTPVTSTPEM